MYERLNGGFIWIENFSIDRLITEITEFLSPPKLSRCTVLKHQMNQLAMFTVIAVDF